MSLKTMLRNPALDRRHKECNKCGKKQFTFATKCRSCDGTFIETNKPITKKHVELIKTQEARERAYGTLVTIIEEAQMREVQLTSYELDFLDNVLIRLETGLNISEKTENVLSNIYKKIFKI